MHAHFVSLYRFIFAILGLSAIITEIVVLIDRGTFDPVNFFSFFTILSNVLAVAVFSTFCYLAVSKRVISYNLQLFKGAVTLYMFMTGVIFAVLLAPIENAVLTAVAWDNIVLHYIIPVAICIDWLFLQRKVTITFSKSLVWLGFPAIYVIYSLIRGHFVNWYPYPFLDAASNGYGKVTVIIIVLLAFVLAASQVVRKMSGRFAIHTSTK